MGLHRALGMPCRARRVADGRHSLRPDRDGLESLALRDELVEGRRSGDRLIAERNRRQACHAAFERRLDLVGAADEGALQSLVTKATSAEVSITLIGLMTAPVFSAP